MNHIESNSIQFYLAPMESVTGYVYRTVYQAMFGDMDKYVTPFIAPSKKKILKTRERKDVAPEHNQGMYVVPQILTNDAEQFLVTCNTLSELGYREVNLNLGCPMATVVSKKKGSGFLEEPDWLDRFFDTVFEEMGRQPVTTAELKEYHDRLYAGYREEMDCERDALFKMKEVWFYLGKMFPEAERELKKAKKADRPEEYLAAVRGVFRG